MKYEAIITDFDDTLLRSDGAILPETISAIKDYEKRGGKFVICTGRNLSSMLKIAKNLNLTGYVIASQGAIIYNLDNGEYILNEGIEPSIAVEVLRDLESLGEYAQVYFDGDAYNDKSVEEITDYYENACNIKVVNLNEKLSEHILRTQKKTHKILSITSEEKIPGLIEKFSNKYGDKLLVNTSKPVLFEIVDKRLTKGTAIEKLSTIIGVDTKNMIGIGDSMNDIPLLNAVGLKIAVANASQVLKDVADEVTVSCDENALGVIIEKYGK